MTGNLRWHSCSTDDFPLKRHKVSKACEACRGKKMRCDGKNPCQRCESSEIKCTYNDKPVKPRSKIVDIKKPIQTIVQSETITTKTKTKSHSSASSSVYSPSSSISSPVSIKPLTENNSTLTVECMKKISLVNDTYETLRLHQSPKTQRYGTSTPPLLLDFFNTTSQPQTIWSCFIICLNRFCDSQPIPDNAYFMRDAPETESNELVKETFRLFVTHNSLYGSFIDTELLLFVLDSVCMFSYMQQSPPEIKDAHLPFQDNSLPYYSIVIYCILAITFQSAYQSLPNMNENFTNSLYIYSHVFYREAHKRFLAICFPSIPADPSTTKKSDEKRNMIILVQASVLLTHFQCTAISEEQAFMTIKMGIHLVNQHGLNQIKYTKEKAYEDESLVVLIKSMDAWYVWLAFYLQKPYSLVELDTSQMAPGSLQQLQEQRDQMDVFFSKKNKEQKWAMYVTDGFTTLLKTFLESRQADRSITTSYIKESLVYLNNIIFNDYGDEESIPSNIILLYHDMLTIQLYTCQLENYQFTETDMPPYKNEHIAQDMLTMCLFASQNVLTTVNKVIFVEYNNTNATTPLKYIPLSVIYSVSLMSQMDAFFVYNKKSILLQSNTKEIDQLHASLEKMLKIASPYFEAFQILYSKFKKVQVNSPSYSALSTSSSTNTATATQTHGVKVTMALTPDTQQHFLNHPNELFMNEPIMSLPVGGNTIRSRANIDREQLEKLSHNKGGSSSTVNQELQLQQQLFLREQQRLNQIQFEQQARHNNNGYAMQRCVQHPSSKKSCSPQQNVNINDPVYFYDNTSQKRSYPQQMYNPYMTPTPSKRHRSSTATSFDEFSNHKTNSLVVENETQHERSKSVNTASTGFMDLESNQDNFMYSMWFLEGGQPEDMYDGRAKTLNNNTFLPQQPPQQQDTNSNLTKLPLPQPSKQASMIPKNWSAPAQTWSKFFFESEVQTLHFQTPPLIHFESNNSFPMVGLNVIQEEVVEETPNVLCSTNHRASIISEHSSGSSSSSGNLMPSTTNPTVVSSSHPSPEDVDAAAVVAAAAVWASTAAGVFPTTTNDKSTSLCPNMYRQHKAAAEDQFWGE